MQICRLTMLAALSGVFLSGQTATNWQLVWSDEFNGPAQTLPDPAKWNYDLGGGGWGNQELETYTNSTSNIFQDGKGNLVIRAVRDAAGNYTSARIRTGKTDPRDTVDLKWQYGKIEARIKLPFGLGVWPAFWMLGGNLPATPWPDCGEIDILENFGGKFDNASTTHATIHGPPAGSDFAGTGISIAYTLPRGQKLTDDFHLFSVEWAQDSIQFSLDGVPYQKLTPASIPGRTWVFNHSFFILLNLAIGGPGTFLGTPDANTPFPQQMLIDYVRVYQAAAPSTKPAVSPGGVVNAASGLGTLTRGALASLYGSNLADATYTSSTPSGSGLYQNGAFVTSTASGVSVAVNGVKAPLTFVSPGQINFQVPWEIDLAPAPANVTVTWNGMSSDPEAVTITPESPSVFMDYSTGAAIVSECTNGTVSAGAQCVLWGNGFGPKNLAETDGTPAAAATLNDILTVNSCQLTIGGQPATITYCGAAPHLIIDQLNFVYPSGVQSSNGLASASLTINGISGAFQLPAPGL